MKVFYSKGKHVIVLFPAHELKQALGVLKALAKYFKQTFIFDVARDLERDLSQPALPFFPTFHICESCFCEIDVRKNNHTHKDDSWMHIVCPPLKERGQ